MREGEYVQEVKEGWRKSRRRSGWQGDVLQMGVYSNVHQGRETMRKYVRRELGKGQVRNKSSDIR